MTISRLKFTFPHGFEESEMLRNAKVCNSTATFFAPTRNEESPKICTFPILFLHLRIWTQRRIQGFFDFASADMDSSIHAEQIPIAIAILCLIRKNFARDSATVSEPTASKDLRPPCR